MVRHRGLSGAEPRGRVDLSGGSIEEERYVPLFTVGGEATLDDLETLLDRLGVGCTTSRETEVEPESTRCGVSAGD